MLRLVRGVLRSAVAWIAGFLLTYVLVSIGTIPGGSGVRGAAVTYLDAHILAAELGVIVPVVVVANMGYRTGGGLRTGVTGRLRSLVQSVRGTERNRLQAAAMAGAILAGSYAILSSLVALLLGVTVSSVALRTFLVALVVGVPTAVLGAYGLPSRE